MKGSNLFYIAVTATVLLSCSVVSHGGSRGAAADPAVRAAKYYPTPERATFLYTEGLKNSLMHGDPRRSAALFGEVLKLDSLHAPTYYELANLFAQTPQQAIPYSSIRRIRGISPNSDSSIWERKLTIQRCGFTTNC